MQAPLHSSLFLSLAWLWLCLCPGLCLSPSPSAPPRLQLQHQLELQPRHQRQLRHQLHTADSLPGPSTDSTGIPEFIPDFNRYNITHKITCLYRWLIEKLRALLFAARIWKVVIFGFVNFGLENLRWRNIESKTCSVKF